jgi:anti-sigma regulatory factor (Ser/Thr protein kinase)
MGTRRTRDPRAKAAVGPKFLDIAIRARCSATHLEPKGDRRIVRSDTGRKRAMRVELDLPHDVASTALARARIGAILRDADQPQSVRDDANIIVTELVTNAVLHGQSPIRLTVIVDEAIRLGVFDGDNRPEVVVLQPMDHGRIGGRGLVLVDNIADAWGTTSDPDGKTVWADLRLVDNG